MSPTTAASPIELLELALTIDPNVVPRTTDALLRYLPPRDMRAYEKRHELVARFSWAIPNEEALQAIAALSPIVEIGAGTGYWASLLAARGADVVAYDEKPGFNDWCDHEPYFPVTVGSWQRLYSHPDRTLFLCWPPYDNPLAVRALEVHTGQRVVYVGEGSGGCCADDAFFRLLDERWEEEREVPIPQWFGLHDTCTIHRRKGRRAIRMGGGA